MLPADENVREILGEKALPVLCEKHAPLPPHLVSVESDTVSLHFDLLGTIFYILTRGEEQVNPLRDEHGRFPAAASHAYQESYLHRPVVDEMVEILWGCMKHLWPGLERKPREFLMKLTHDVDAPFRDAFKTTFQVIRTMGGDILKRKNPRQAFSHGINWLYGKIGRERQDPYDTFDLIMDLGEQHGVEDDFYFIPQSTHPLDGNYTLEHPRIHRLMKRIHQRGHKIGYHGSYTTYQDPEKTRREVARLKEAAHSLGIEQEIWGGPTALSPVGSPHHMG
jgi:hypothetical protein